MEIYFLEAINVIVIWEIYMEAIIESALSGLPTNYINVDLAQHNGKQMFISSIKDDNDLKLRL